jgi:hypothetical protein
VASVPQGVRGDSSREFAEDLLVHACVKHFWNRLHDVQAIAEEF